MVWHGFRQPIMNIYNDSAIASTQYNKANKVMFGSTLMNALLDLNWMALALYCHVHIDCVLPFLFSMMNSSFWWFSLGQIVSVLPLLKIKSRNF